MFRRRSARHPDARRGRATSSPPQFGHRASSASPQSLQNVHSKLQIRAGPSGVSALPQRSHTSLISRLTVSLPSLRLLEAAECREHEVAERVEHVATFLHEHRRDLHQAERLTDRGVSARRELERAVGVGGGTVDSERHHERVGSPLRRLGDELGHGAQPRLVARALRQRQVAVGSDTVAGSLLVGETDEVREPTLPRIDVCGAVEDVASRVEDLLRAVAVVRVDVDDRDAPDAAIAQVLRGDRGIVEIAGTAVEVGADVVTGRAHRRVRGSRASEHEVAGRERAVDGDACGRVGARPDERHRVHGVETRERSDRGWLPAGPGRGDVRQREHVGHDDRLPGIVEVALLDPAPVRRLEVRDEPRRVHAQQRLVAVLGSRLQLRTCVPQRVSERVAALRAPRRRGR